MSLKAPHSRRKVTSRFPASLYPSSSPFPSLCSPVSPLRFPMPYNDDQIPLTLPLNDRELQNRVILQSIADQIDEVWNGETHGSRSDNRHTVCSRDFMTVYIPSHDLADLENAQMREWTNETRLVMKAWGKEGNLEGVLRIMKDVTLIP